MNDMTTETFEHDWRETLSNSQNKSREWLFRHATDIYKFKVACRQQKLDGLGGPGKYYCKKVEEWLGYSKESASQWAKAGEFISAVQAGRKLSEFEFADLPASKATLIEFARMSDTELKKAQDAEIIRPEITVQELKDFRELLRLEAAEREAAATKARAEQDKKIEEEVLRWRYDDSVPEELIDILEDTDEATLNGIVTDGCEWICTRINKLWTAVEIKPKPQGTSRAKTKASPSKVKTISYIEEDLFVQQTKFFGIDIMEGKIAEETMSWILAGYRRTHHPDKGAHNAELTQEAVTRVKKMFPSNNRNW